MSLSKRLLVGIDLMNIIIRTMQLDKTIWGPDARDFKPERWLAEDAASKEKYWLVVCSSPVLVTS